MDDKLKIKEELEKTDFSMKMLYLKSKNGKKLVKFINKL